MALANKSNLADHFSATSSCSKCGKVGRIGNIARHEETCGEGWSMFLARVTMHDNGCWTYTASTVMRQGKAMHAHKYAWTTMNGPVPLGRVLKINCGYKKCVNPEHMRLGRRGE